MANQSNTVEYLIRARDNFSGSAGRISNSINRMQRRLRQASSAMSSFSQNVSNGRNNLRQLGDSVGAPLEALVAGGGVALAMGNIVKIGAQFEQSVTNAVARLPEVMENGAISSQKAQLAVAKLSKEFRRLGSTTEFSASEVAKAGEKMAMAGFNADQIIATLGGAIDLATASGGDLVRATDIATDALGSFGLMTTDTTKLMQNMAKVNDVLATTTSSANLDVSMFFESMKEAGPSFTAAGQSMATFSALVGTMASAGLKGSRAGTALKNMAVRLQAPVGKGKKLIKALGLTIKDDLTGGMRNAVDIIGDFKEKTKDMDAVTREAVTSQIFGMEALSGVQILLGKTKKELEDYRKKIDAANGSNKAMAGFMRTTVQGSLNSLGSAVESVKISIFSLENKGIKKTIDRMTEWVRANEKLIAQNVAKFLALIVDNLDNIITWVKRIAIGVAVFMALSMAIKAVNTALALVAIFSNPWILLITLIAAGAVLIIKNWDKIKGFLNGLVADAKIIFNDLMFSITESWDNLVKGIVQFDFIKFFSDIAKFVASNNPFTLLMGGLNALIEKITGFNIGAILKGKISSMMGGLPKSVKDFVFGGVDFSAGKFAAPEMVSAGKFAAPEMVKQEFSGGGGEIKVKFDVGLADGLAQKEKPKVASSGAGASADVGNNFIRARDR